MIPLRFVPRCCVAILAASGLLGACTLGSERTPGCRPGHPDDCGKDWACRGGLCVRSTTPSSPQPEDAPGDPEDADASGEDGSDEPELPEEDSGSEE